MTKVLGIILSLALIISPCMVEAGWLFHATKRSLAKKILQRGFSQKAMSKKARFGKGAYLSTSKETALKEKPKADAVVVFKDTKTLKKNTINLKNSSKESIKGISGDGDLRGNIHSGVVGPELGRKIGREAGKGGKIVTYQSAKDRGGTNVYIPASVYEKHPGIVKPTGVIEYVK